MGTREKNQKTRGKKMSDQLKLGTIEAKTREQLWDEVFRIKERVVDRGSSRYIQTKITLEMAIELMLQMRGEMAEAGLQPTQQLENQYKSLLEVHKCNIDAENDQINIDKLRLIHLSSTG